MKLLSIKDNQKAKDREVTINKIRVEELTEQVSSKRESLNLINDEFEKTLKNQQQIWEKEKEDHASWRNQAQVEVSELENRRFLALLPIEEQQKKLNNERQEFEVEKALFDSEKEVFEQSKIALQTHLDQVAERELQAYKKEQSLKAREIGIEQQASSIVKQSKELSSRLVEFSREMSDKKKMLDTREQIVTTKQDGLEIQRRRLDGWEIDLNRRERLLQSNYQALEQAKQQIYGSGIPT